MNRLGGWSVRPGVEVWPVDLDAEPLEPSWLSADEEAACARKATPELRRRSRAARQGLRRVLGGVLDLPPESLEFALRRGGKPELSLPEPPYFNHSHAEGRSLVAVRRDGPVGVDLERVRLDLPVADLLAERFSPDLAEPILALPRAAQPRAFLQLWTRFEAHVKGLGTGLARETDGWGFASLYPNCHYVIDGGPGSGGERWWLVDLDLGTDWVGCVAVPGEWPPDVRLHADSGA